MGMMMLPTGLLEQQKCILSQFWALEAEDQGICRAVLLLKALEKDVFLASLLASSSFLACGSTTPICTSCRPYVHACVQTSFDKDASHIGLEAQLLLQHDFILTDYISNAPISK